MGTVALVGVGRVTPHAKAIWSSAPGKFDISNAIACILVQI